MRNWQLIKPTKMTIREFGSVTGVEDLYFRDPKGNVWTPTCTYAGFIVLQSRTFGLFYLSFFSICVIITRLRVTNMLIMPILNTGKNGISKIYMVEVSLKKVVKARENTIIKGINESDIVINGTSFNNSLYNTKAIKPNVIVNFLRNFNYKANKKDFLVSTREYTDSSMYDLYSIPVPPRKITAGLDNLYGSAILDLKKKIPNSNKGRYLSLKQLGVDKHITDDKMEKLIYFSSIEKDKTKRNDILQLNGVSDLAKSIEFMRLFDCTIIKDATITEKELSDMVSTLSCVNTRDYKNLSRLYEIAKENRDVYAKLSKISKVLDNTPLNLIQSKSKSKVLVKINDGSKAA